MTNDGHADRLQYDPQTQTYHLEYDRNGRGDIVTNAVLAVANIAGVDPTDMEPLYHTVDGETLDRLFGARDEGSEIEGSVSFELEGCRVTVRDGGEMTISDA